MALFINNDNHPDVYKSQLDIKEPNQSVYKQDYMSEMIKEQKEANELLRKSFQELEEEYKKQTQLQSRRITSIKYNLKKLDDRSTEQKEVESGVIDSLEKYGEKNEELILKMAQQIDLQQKMETQVLKHQNTQDEVISRLENQEALSEKMVRQIDSLRSALYERTHFLAEKIEESYKSTSSYINQIISGSELPIVRYKLKRNEKSID
ncbi:hypothetical protein [Sporosarcina sp. G11-34]|uniref:hypothetical protein n=1 Tax=Sporosarcina sp. G11-34 TaxID=2849605 RepID=UPI0022A9BA6D|nr:hypothetical protein [Sporosarcina sp. G11-34]MCZ2260520.1 hypothetical protein [Sporosarcina sp. G11-34]